MSSADYDYDQMTPVDMNLYLWLFVDYYVVVGITFVDVVVVVDYWHLDSIHIIIEPDYGDDDDGGGCVGAAAGDDGVDRMWRLCDADPSCSVGAYV